MHRGKNGIHVDEMSCMHAEVIHRGYYAGNKKSVRSTLMYLSSAPSLLGSDANFTGLVGVVGFVSL